MKRTKMEFLLFTLLMSLAMSGAMSFSLMLIELGLFNFDYLEWIRKWALSMLIAYPISVFASPPVSAVATRITRLQRRALSQRYSEDST